MIDKILKILNKSFPQNFILNKPIIGSMVFLVFTFAFILIYRPLKAHEGQFLNFAGTMAVYCFIFSLSIFLLIRIFARLSYFSKNKDWTIVKELISIGLILSVMGIATYFAGFLMEEPSSRWNLPTFLDSLQKTFLIGIIPFGFFTMLNLKHLLTTDIILQIDPNNYEPNRNNVLEEKIQIASRLKKEELSFYPDQLIYAESDSNYVVFYLKENEQVRKEIIRNSISSIEQQFSTIPQFFRTHRAFIVNVKMIYQKKGNSLGYRLKLKDIDYEIPVSRQNTQSFDRLLNNYIHPSVTKNYHS